MNRPEYERLYKFERYYWWHVGRAFVIRNLLKKHLKKHGERRILDEGCGTGQNLKLLSKFGRVTGVDKSPLALDFCRQRGLSNIVQMDAVQLKFPEGSFDLVTMLDLLEHIEDDQKALQEAWRVLKPGGLILLTVPAYQFLWSEHDEALNHKRRYSKRELEQKLKKANFRIHKLSFAITSLCLPILLFRLFQKAFIKSSIPKTSYILLPGWLNGLFVFLLRVEAELLRFVNLPFGVSLIALGEKC